MPKTFNLITITALAGLCIVSSPGYAKQLPNSSAVDQYIEAVPTAGGPKTSTVGGASLPGEAQTSDGKNGAAAAAPVKTTAPDSTGVGRSETSGMGIGLPLLLIAALLSVVTAFVARRRRRDISTR